jgi:hypothetical protein
METIFDHKVTEEEYDKLWCRVYSKEEIQAEFDDHDCRVGAIAQLYFLRQDRKTALKYVEQMKSNTRKQDLRHFITEVRPLHNPEDRRKARAYMKARDYEGLKALYGG